MALDVKQPKGYRKAWNGGKRPEPSAREIVFHEHLDSCRQCADHPFDLCVVGATLLRIAIDQPPAVVAVDPHVTDTGKLTTRDKASSSPSEDTSRTRKR